ncbi:MAG: tetratricopeptide repeat protein [Acidobacteria bacterium]|nr:tetratricopeptide repeat protein [Acidobacteriota bacterium]
MRRKHGLGLLMAVLLAAPALPQTQTPEAMLGAALHQERVTGNLQAAIDGYRKVLAMKTVPRSVAALAQYHIGVCYEKLGNQEARKAFENVVRNYADQKDLAAQARARLAAMGGAGAGKETRARLLWDGAAGDVWGVSYDGRWISSPDPQTQDLVIRDLISGEQRRVTNKGAKATAGVVTSVVSRDGSQIAFLWIEGNDRRVSLRTVRADGTGERVLLELEQHQHQWMQPFGWSPDGKWIAVRKGYSDTGWRILLISAEDGSERVLVTREALRLAIPGLMKFSPDGRWLAYNAPSARGEAAIHVVSLSASPAAPMETAVDGRLIGWTPDGTGILFNRRQGDSREVYLLPVSNGKAAGEPRKIAAAQGFRGYPLAVTANGALVYHTGTSRSWDGVVSEFDLNSNSIGKAVISQPSTASGWHGMGEGVRFSPDGRRVLITLAQGHLLMRSLDSGAATLVAAAEDGLSTCFASFVPSPDGKSAYCAVASGISVIDLGTGKVRRSVLARTAYAVQDMRFSHDGKKLALFGGGAVDIVDLATGRFQEIVRAPGNYLGGDWSPDDRFLLTTWCAGRYHSDMSTELVKLPVDGGPPSRTALDGHYIGLRLSPDGKRAATTRWGAEQRNQVWVLENFLPATVAQKK